jgi:protein-tyrosine phosphatase
MKILMVCLGNICRSPMAEGILQNKCTKAELDWLIDSAGTNGFHNGEAPHHLSQKVAALHHINLQHQISRQFTVADIENFDIIYALANDVLQDIKKIAGQKYDASKIKLLMNELHPNKNIDVPDPWYGNEQGYHEVYTMLDKACDAVLKNNCTLQKMYTI